MSAAGLGVKEVVIVECGTAFRILRALLGKLPFKVSSIVEVVDRYLREGRIRLKEHALSAPVTVRASQTSPYAPPPIFRNTS